MRHLTPAVLNIRRVHDQSVPLPFDVLVGGLRGDIQAIKLQLPCNFLLTFEDHQWYLPIDVVMMLRLLNLCSVASVLNFIKGVGNVLTVPSGSSNQ